MVWLCLKCLLDRRRNAGHMISVNDKYSKAYSSKDDKRGLQHQRNQHTPNTYPKNGEVFPSVPVITEIMGSKANNTRLLRFICWQTREHIDRIKPEIIDLIRGIDMSISQDMERWSCFLISLKQTQIFSQLMVFYIAITLTFMLLLHMFHISSTKIYLSSKMIQW